METFVIEGEGGLSVKFHSPGLSDDGWIDEYLVTLAGNGLEATLAVHNPPYGTHPPDFFSDLSQAWRGWRGEKSWASIEGELSFTAVTDKTGHVSLTIELHSSHCVSCWQSEITIMVEAGMLETAARKAKAFFFPVANK